MEIEAKTSRGHGGQSVNTTYSAVRVTHKPTGITVTVQNERSQAQNRERAMSLLRSKLYHLMQEREAKELKDLRVKAKPEWGSQMRSYVLHPYQLVKDHRTNAETGNIDGVLEGELDIFIESELQL